MSNHDRESLVTDMTDFIHDRRAELGWGWYDLDYGDELAAIAERVVDFMAAQRVADE
jgi:hypothetical protein